MADTTDTPPRKRTPPGSPRLTEPEYTPKGPGTPIKALEKKLATMVAGFALPFAVAGDMHCAHLVASRAEPIAEAWANLANQSPPVKRALESMLRGGAWAGAIGTTLPVFVGIAAHHGMIPAQYADPFNALIFGPGPTPQPANGGEDDEPPTPSSNGATGTGPGSFPPFPNTDTPLA